MEALLAILARLWGAAWGLRQWHRSGPVVRAETGLGQVGKDGVLTVFFRSGESDVVHLGDPRGEKVPPDKLAVVATLIHNEGRGPVTVLRSYYEADFGFAIHPLPVGSPWGDELPKRLEPGDALILIQERSGLTDFQGKTMRAHDVERAEWRVILSLGNGDEVTANPPIPVCIQLDDEAVQEDSRSGGRMTKELVDNPWDDAL